MTHDGSAQSMRADDCPPTLPSPARAEGNSVDLAGGVDRRSFLRIGAVAAVGGVVSITVRPAFGAENVRNIGTEPQLFLDDWIVEQNNGLKRVLHRPEKQGLVKQADGADWDLGSVYLGNVVCRDARGRFHMTYRYSWWDASVRDLHPSIGEDKAHWFRESVGYATSTDGIHWEKPRLGLVEGPTGFKKIDEFPFAQPAGMSRDNNLGCPFDFACDLHAHGNITDKDKLFLLRAVKMDDTHPFAKAIESQLYYAADWPDIVNDARWREKLTPVPKGDLSPRGFKSMAGFDRDAGQWFAVSQDRLGNWRPRGGRDIARFASKDLVDWQGPEHVLAVAADESRDVKDWVEYMDLLAYRSGGPQSGAWLGQLVIFHGDRSNPQYSMPRTNDVWRKGTTELRLVISHDAGKSWKRVGDKQTWLACSDDPHGFDRLVFATYPVRVGDEAWFYYCAWDGDHLVFNRDGSLFEPGFLRTHRVARAAMRWNGYVSLDADASGGTLTTMPFELQGEKLTVNANVAKGRLIAELHDETGRPIEGFTAADAKPLTGDGVDLPIQWRGRNLATQRNRTVFLKLELTNGSLYGFRVS